MRVTLRKRAKRMVHWEIRQEPSALVIVSRGHDKSGTIAQVIDRFERLASTRTEPTPLIADLRQMTGYESAVRQAWQEALARQRPKINRIVIVGARSAMIRMGAAVVGAYSGVPVSFVKDWNDLADVGLSA